VKFAFIAKHREIWPAGWLCGALGASRGGFYGWLTRPRSQRSRSDEDLGAKVRASFLASDRTYGARRIWKDLLADGVACGRRQIERLMRPGLTGEAATAAPAVRSGGTPGECRRSQCACPGLRGASSQPQMDRRLHLHLDGGRLALRGRRHRSILPARGGLVDERSDDGTARYRRTDHGDLAAGQA
jgi:HTH-like domain